METDCSQERLDRIKARLATIPEGVALLALATAQDCDIEFQPVSSKLSSNFSHAGGVLKLTSPIIFSTQTFNIALHDDTPARFKIMLSPNMSDDETTYVLAHELRHLWQKGILAEDKILNLSIPFDMAVSRVLEGDAHAYQDYIQARFENPAVKTAADFDWKTAFNRFQQSDVSVGYDHAQYNQSQERLSMLLSLRKAGHIDAETTYKFAAGIFNRHSLKELGDLAQLTKAGLADDAPNYMGDLTSAALLRHVQSYGNREDFEQAQDAMRRVHPTLAKDYTPSTRRPPQKHP